MRATHSPRAAALSSYPAGDRSSLIPLLQRLQEEAGYLSRETMEAVAAHLGLSVARVYGVATFYNQFRFEPLGRYHIQVCRGTACHVRGSKGLLEILERELGIAAGRTSGDGLFSLEVVACIGACGLAPVAAVNGTFHGNLSRSSVRRLLKRLRKETTAREGDDDHSHM